jgi:DNA-binding FadR family transcriptional regulator
MSDDTQEFKDAQRRHGEKIRAERAIMDMAGVSRSQARAALSGCVPTSDYRRS